MPNIVHSFNKEKIEKNINEDISFILTNKIGGYCYFSNKPTSRYQGIFFNDNFKMYKVVDQIKTKEGIKEIKNNFYNIEIKKKGLTEKYFMPYGYNSLIYELNKPKDIELVLDIRESYKNPEFGRSYEINEEDSKIIIRYTQENEFNCYVVISGYSNFEKIEKWFKQDYELDKKRNSVPYEKYVFSTLKLNSKNLVISFSKYKEKAIEENKFIVDNINLLKKIQKDYIKNLFKKVNVKNKNTKFAYYCALKQLDDLTTTVGNKVGIFAGLPWFFHFWTRDELISLKALLLMKKYFEVKKIVSRLTNNISKQGFINRFPEGIIASSDSVGWYCKILEDLQKKDFLIKKNKKKIIKKLEYYVMRSVHKNMDNNLISNKEKETWMDSIDRSGVRIEIQALWLVTFKLLYHLTKKKKYKLYEHRLRKNVREKLWNTKFLADGLNDWTIRPNLFIADYIYPKLLSKELWTRCFDHALHHLWLDYGGLSTIDKEDTLFRKTHTGENNISYHNGDSWFYINNMVALVLHRTNKKHFKRYIDKIIKASTEEILWKGAIGHHAELSSASKLKSEGCLSQAWSSAMFIELVDELK